MMKSPDPFLNRQIDEYRIEALLGRGGMARVYRGIDVHLNRYVAVKVIDTPYQRESEYIKRFSREAQVIARLTHPNIVQLYRYGEKDGFIYMVMQYIEGADLYTLLSGYRKDGEFIEPREILQISQDVLQALDYVHKRGVIHRDVKPSNILLNRDGQAFLSDFGLALLTEIGTMGQTFGSPQYIAPEQALSSAKAEPRSDLYAYGVVLYEMLTGRLPFRAEDPLELAMQHMTESPPSPRQFRPALHPAVEEVLLKALSKEPEDRYESGADLYKALERALQEAPVLEEPPETISHLTIPDRVRLEVDSHPLESIQTASEEGRGSKPPEERTPQTAQEPVLATGAAVPPVPPVEPIAAKSPRRNMPALIGAGVLGILLVSLACICGVVFLGSQMGWLSFPSGDRAGDLPTASIRETQATQRTRTPTTTQAPLESTPGATAPAALENYALEMVKAGEDSLFVINQGSAPVPLSSLQLGNPPGRVLGDEWGPQWLDAGQCVTVWKDSGKPKSPKGVSCNQVGEHLTRSGAERFWKSDFNVYFDGEFITACPARQDRCSIVVAEP